MKLLTILYVDDVERCGSFYERVFGWRSTVDLPQYREFFINEGASLGLMRRQSATAFLGEDLAARIPSSGAPKAELYITGDLSTLVARLEEIHAVVVSPVGERDWGDLAGYYLDPEGHVVAVAARKDTA